MSDGDKYDIQYDEASGLFSEEVREHFKQMGYECSEKVYVPITDNLGECYQSFTEIKEKRPELFEDDAPQPPYHVMSLKEFEAYTKEKEAGIMWSIEQDEMQAMAEAEAIAQAEAEAAECYDEGW